MEKKIIEILRDNIEELKGIDVKPDTQLISSGYLESFDIINIVVGLEEAFDIELSLDNMEFEDFNTVKNIAELVSKTKGQ